MLSTLSKYILILIGFCLLSSCYMIHYKRFVLNESLRGDSEQRIRLDGYYYTTTETTAYPFEKNEYGGYTEDKEHPYQQKWIRTVVCYPNGNLSLYGASGMQENYAFDFTWHCGLLDANTVASALAHFECRYSHEEDLTDIWDKGVFGVSDNSITIQYYRNYGGMYYLIEKRGEILSDTSFVLTEYYDYKLDRTREIDERYQFKVYSPLRDSESFISKYPKRFGRR